MHYPTYEEWSLALEQEVTHQVVLSASYVGNHGYHETVVDGGANAYGFDTLPAAPPTEEFGQVNRVYSGASSNFNGMVLSAARRGKALSLQFNYAYGHALDEISNGGFDAFGINPVNPFNPYNLKQNYGNSDYDVRHYISANYVIERSPRWRTQSAVGSLDGRRHCISQHRISLQLHRFQHASELCRLHPRHADTRWRLQHNCGGARHAGVNAVPCDSANFFAPATAFGQQRRNQLFGPNYTDSDLDVVKGFGIP